jgi:hypothetical protein
MMNKQDDSGGGPSSASSNDVGDATRNDSLAGDEFALRIRKGELTGLSGHRVLGKVNLTGVTVEEPLIIHDTVFTGEVDFTQARFKRGVDLVGCRFEQELIFSDAGVEGPLRIDNVTIGTDAEAFVDIEMLRLKVARLQKGWSRARLLRQQPGDEKPPQRARLTQSILRSEERLQKAEAGLTGLKICARFDNLRVEGSLSMTRVNVRGGISCNHSEIESDLRLARAVIHGGLSLRHSKLGELRTDSELVVDSATKDEGSNQVKGCLIGGGLDLDSATVTGDVFLFGITIGGELRLQAADINGSFVCRAEAGQRTRLRKGAWLLAARVKGNVDFGGARVHGDLGLVVANIGGGLQCSRGSKWFFMIDGDVNAANVRVAADFDWGGCHIRGDFNSSGAKIENAAALHFAYFEKDIALYNAVIKGNFVLLATHVGGNLFMENASVGGSVFLTASTWLPQNRRCRIDKKLWLLGIIVSGDIDLSGALVGGDLIMQNANVGENVRARSMGGFALEIGGVTYLNGSRIRGTLEFAGITLKGELDIDNVTIDGKFLVTYDFDDQANWNVVRSQIAQRLHAESATIGKGVMLMGLTVGSPAAGAAPVTANVSFVGGQINGQFSLYSREHVEQMLVAKKAGLDATAITPEFEEEIRTRTFSELTVIHGNLSLSRAQVLGGVVLDGAMVHGDLDLRDATVKADISCKPVDMGKSLARALVQRADFEALEMTGDIDLTGLNIVGKGTEGKDGDLILRNARIRGRLELCPLNNERGFVDPQVPLEPISRIAGDLRLDAAEISHVILSGQTFEGGVQAEEGGSGRLAEAWQWTKPIIFGGTDEENKRIRFGLERGRIGRLQIVEPLPGTLDLSNLKVERWSLPEDQTSYERMLRNSFPFKRSNYLAIENTLRNEGLEERADEVNVSMRRRDRQSTKSLWKIWFESFLDLSIKYGTTSKRLACVMLALFALSLWVFADPNHVEYSLSPASQKPPPIEHPAPANWGVRQSAFFAARLNVPIVSLGIDEKVQPSGFWVKMFGVGVMAASWVMWPLLIASMSGFIRKKN